MQPCVWLGWGCLQVLASRANPHMITLASCLAHRTWRFRGRRLICRVMQKAELEEMFRRLPARLPEPKGELAYINPYTLLADDARSAQATDVAVHKATGPLCRVADATARETGEGTGED